MRKNEKQSSSVVENNLLALVDNLSSVDVNSKTNNYHLTIEKANKMVNGKIKDYGSSPQNLKELNNILNPQD